MVELRQEWLSRAVPLECKGMVLNVSKLGPCVRAALLPTDGSVFVLSGSGVKWHQLVRLPTEGFPWILPLREMLWEEWVISLKYTPDTVQITVSMLYAPGLFACLLSKSSTVPYPSQAQWPLEFQALTLVVVRTHEIKPFLSSKPVAMGKHSLCAVPCTSLSCPSPWPWLPPLWSSQDLFLS